MGLLAGSTVLILTLIWGSCVVVGKCDIRNSVAIDNKDTKGFSLTGIFFFFFGQLLNWYIRPLYTVCIFSFLCSLHLSKMILSSYGKISTFHTEDSETHQKTWRGKDQCSIFENLPCVFHLGANFLFYSAIVVLFHEIWTRPPPAEWSVSWRNGCSLLRDPLSFEKLMREHKSWFKQKIWTNVISFFNS